MNRPETASHFGLGEPFDENPEWTDEDFAKARPADEILPAHVVATLTEAERQVEITLELDGDVVEKFQATGAGWQARINAALRAAEV